MSASLLASWTLLRSGDVNCWPSNRWLASCSLLTSAWSLEIRADSNRSRRSQVATSSSWARVTLDTSSSSWNKYINYTHNEKKSYWYKSMVFKIILKGNIMFSKHIWCFEWWLEGKSWQETLFFQQYFFFLSYFVCFCNPVIASFQLSFETVVLLHKVINHLSTSLLIFSKTNKMEYFNILLMRKSISKINNIYKK